MTLALILPPELLVPLVVAAFLVPMAYRLATPAPESDLKAIELFLKDRNQTLVELRKRWVGGPPGSGRAYPVQIGRPYRVLAKGADGSEWKHDLATIADGLGRDRKLMERSYGVWTPVLQ